MTKDWRDDDSIAEKLARTRWDYRQSDDRRFLLDPIGRIFRTFCWDGQPKQIPLARKGEDDHRGPGADH
jgi:hypothetical protein